MHAGTSGSKGLLAEMAAILLVSALLGGAWNHRLLYNAWTGSAPAAAEESAEPRRYLPLPLGLMQVKELFDRKEALFVDARDGKEFAAGHIPGAVSLPVGEFAARAGEFKGKVPPATMLVVYCNGYDCHDSRELGTQLLQTGYQAVYVFEGGFPEWRDAGYPTGGAR